MTNVYHGRTIWMLRVEHLHGNLAVLLYTLLKPVNSPTAPEEAPPSPDYVPRPKHPPSPDYVPGPEYLLSLEYVPKPEYPKYLVPFDAEVPIEDQPLPDNASPTALSPGYVADSDLEEDPNVTPRQGGNARRKQEWISSQHTVSL
ncbi:hypothetical protein Tco_0951048 [Tanacetum coccineum]|uniref:Uncharacterized protein n=1 Tax=Tanacetum coccineum TaxID=301880 RepID=A0ABQ5DUS2_9ASTR